MRRPWGRALRWKSSPFSAPSSPLHSNPKPKHGCLPSGLHKDRELLNSKMVGSWILITYTNCQCSANFPEFLWLNLRWHHIPQKSSRLWRPWRRYFEILLVFLCVVARPGDQLPELKSRLCHWLVVWWWANPRVWTSAFSFVKWRQYFFNKHVVRILWKLGLRPCFLNQAIFKQPVWSSGQRLVLRTQ